MKVPTNADHIRSSMQSTNILQFNAINQCRGVNTNIYTNTNIYISIPIYIYVNTNIYVEVSTPIYSADNLYLHSMQTFKPHSMQTLHANIQTTFNANIQCNIQSKSMQLTATTHRPLQTCWQTKYTGAVTQRRGTNFASSRRTGCTCPALFTCSPALACSVHHHQH